MLVIQSSIRFIYYYKNYYIPSTMAIATKKNKPTKKNKQINTKKDLAQKRVARVKKLLEIRKKNKLKRKGGLVSLKNQRQQQALNEIIQYNTKVQTGEDVTNQQAFILDLLGIGGHQGQWQDQLQKKLTQINSKSLDNPEVRKVYNEIGKIFSTYRSGKIPKAFKVIPNLQKWQQVIQLTRPTEWTPQAMYQAVAVFASNFDPVRAEIFYEHYLVPAIRADLQKNKKLNYHYFQSLKKALYKTNAWFKGIMFQFCEQDTPMKQIKVIQALLRKMTIPVISSSVALIKLTEKEPTTAILHYLLAIVSKHYNFPKRVISTITQYLLRFQSIQKDMPIVWHQLFLNFVKQYGNSIDEMSKSALQKLTKVKHHKLISPEIVKAIAQSNEMN